MNPRVSIIVPSYNHARFLGSCLQGVLNQTFTDWELIVVDDGSTDDSLAVARSFSDTRVQVHKNIKNLGTYGNQQNALSLARGDLVAVLNSDDLWEPEKLERQIALLEKYPQAKLCYALGWKIDDEGVVNTGEDVHADWPTDELQDVLPELLHENRILASGVLFRRTNLRFESSCRYSGDWVALLEQAKRGPVACLTERMTYWRMHEHNTFVASPKQRAEEVRVRRAIAEKGERWARLAQQLAAVQVGLQKNELDLCALEVYFYRRKAALAHGRNAMKMSKDPTATRRTLSLAMPMSMVRRRLWPDELPAKDLAGLRKILLDQPPLSL